MDAILGFLYVALGIVPFAIVRYMPFMNQLRISKRLLWTIFGAMVCGEAALYLRADALGINAEIMRRVYFSVYLVLSCIVIKAPPAKHLLVWLLSALFSSVATALAMLAERGLKPEIRLLAYDITLAALAPLYIWVGARFSRRVVTPLMQEAGNTDCMLFDMMLALVIGIEFIGSAGSQGWDGLPLFTPMQRFLAAGIAVLACLIFRRITSAHRRLYNLQLEKSRREQLLSLEREQYQRLSQSIESTKIARHDLRHHLAAINQYCEQGDLDGLRGYLAQLNAAMPLEQIPHFCENATLNGILAHYREQARKHDITMTIQANADSDTGLSDSEMWVLLGNLMDNAIEGTRHAPQKPREISVRLAQKGHFLGITVDNPCDASALRKSEGWFLSTKDTSGSGMGLKSVLYLAQSHDGSAFFEEKDGWFQSSVSIKKNVQISQSSKSSMR